MKLLKLIAFPFVFIGFKVWEFLCSLGNFLVWLWEKEVFYTLFVFLNVVSIVIQFFLCVEKVVPPTHWGFWIASHFWIVGLSWFIGWILYSCGGDMLEWFVDLIKENYQKTKDTLKL